RGTLVEPVPSELTVGLVVTNHVVDRDEHGMGDGDDGSLVSTPHHETTKFRLVVASLGSHGGGCRLHHDRFQKRIAFAHGDLLSLACTFVIAGTQPGPGSKPMFIRPWQHVIADFTEDRERCIAVET